MLARHGSGCELLLQLLQRFVKHPRQIKQVHSLLIINGFLLCKPNPDPPRKWTNTLLFNALIRAYFSSAQPRNALLLFTHMLVHQAPPNDLTFPPLIKASVFSSPPFGAALHAQVVRRGVSCDPFVQVSFVSFYAHIGKLSDASNVFEEIREPCVVAYNAMLDAFSKNGEVESAVLLFRRMHERDVVSWTSVISGLGHCGHSQDALECFQKMMEHEDVKSGVVKPNEATYVSILSTCANFQRGGALYYGKQIHGYIIRNENGVSAFLGTALIDLYGKTGSLRNAVLVFDQMVVREVCTWNALITSLACNGEEKKALAMFEQMQIQGVCPNGVTFVAVLTSCARAKLVEFGFKLFQSMYDDFGLVPLMEHYGCMVDLLGRAGFLREATDFVRSMPLEPDASVLGALLGACRIHAAVDLGTEVGQKLLDMRPGHCGQYTVLSYIYAELDKWTSAAKLRKVMKDLRIQKVPACSSIDPS